MAQNGGVRKRGAAPGAAPGGVSIAHAAALARELAESLGNLEKAAGRELSDERLIDRDEVLSRVPIHRSTLNSLIKAGRFPAPIAITSSKRFWRLSAILDYIDERERNPVPRRTFRRPTKG